MGIVLDGEMKLTIGNEPRLCQKGDAFAIPGNVEHSVTNGDKLTIVVQAFSPPREDYKWYTMSAECSYDFGEGSLADAIWVSNTR